MEIFETFNQFDKKFSDIGDFKNDRNACPLFALITAYNFLKNSNISKEQHETNIETSILNYSVRDELPKYMSFDELIYFLGNEVLDKNIQATNPELINEHGYTNIFKLDDVENYCIIFLKNGNFFVVLINNLENGDKKYCVRDCHENQQYNFNIIQDLLNHLNQKYSFNELTVVDGVLIEEFANIEYLILDNPFNMITIDPSLHDDVNSIKEEQSKEDELIALQLQMETYQE